MRASSRRSCCRIHCRSPPASRSHRRRSIVSFGSASLKIQKDVGKARAISDASCSGSRATGPTSDAPTPVVTRLWRHERVAWASVTLAALITAASVSFIRVHDQAPMAALGRFQIALPAGSLSFTLSPDGRNLAFIAPGLNGRTQIVWIRPMDSLEPRALPGTENALTPPFWSPDSRFVAFWAGGKLKKIDVTGGLPQIICEAPAAVLGGTWNRDDVIVFGDGRIMRVSAAGGVATPLTAIASPNQFHFFPSFLQDGRHFVYLRFSPDGNQGIYVGSLDATPEQQSTQRLLDTPLMPAYAPSLDPGAGHLLFVRDGTLWSRPFDARRFALAGEAVPIAERVGIFRLGANFSTSANGVLAYRGVGTALSRLTWYDRAGTVLGPAGDQGAYWDVALSPDDSRVATSLDEGRAEGTSISVLELARGVMGRLTFDVGPGDRAPVWSPDGHRIAFVARARRWDRRISKTVEHRRQGTGTAAADERRQVDQRLVARWALPALFQRGS